MKNSDQALPKKCRTPQSQTPALSSLRLRPLQPGLWLTQNTTNHRDPNAKDSLSRKVPVPRDVGVGFQLGLPGRRPRRAESCHRPPPPAPHRLVAVLLLLELLHENGLLLVLAALVLEPHADDPRAQAGHLHQLLLHERVGPRVGGVARPQRVQLLLVEHGPHPGRLLRLLVHVRAQRRLPARPGVCGGRGRQEVGRAGHSPQDFVSLLLRSFGSSVSLSTVGLTRGEDGCAPSPAPGLGRRAQRPPGPVRLWSPAPGLAPPSRPRLRPAGRALSGRGGERGAPPGKGRRPPVLPRACYGPPLAPTLPGSFRLGTAQAFRAQPGSFLTAWPGASAREAPLPPPRGPSAIHTHLQPPQTSVFTTKGSPGVHSTPTPLVDCQQVHTPVPRVRAALFTLTSPLGISRSG